MSSFNLRKIFSLDIFWRDDVKLFFGERMLNLAVKWTNDSTVNK